MLHLSGFLSLRVVTGLGCVRAVVARGVTGLGPYELRLLRDTKLPTFAPGGRMAWPPPTPPIGFEGIIAPAPVLDPERRAAMARAENARMAEYYEKQDRLRREREEREAQEAREALARQVAKRNRAAGWG